MTNRLAILQQYDPAGGVPHYIREHLKGLRPVARRVVLVSNSSIAPEDLAATQQVCDEIIERPNTGWDFAGWRDALTSEDTGNWDEIILTNSSVMGPLYPLKDIFAEMERRRSADPFDFWGMVLSRQKRLHLQSYFFVFSKGVVQSDAWRTFWQGVADIDEKDEVIRRYETGLTMALAKAGFRYAAYMPDLPFLKRIQMVEVERLRMGVKIPWDATRMNRTVRWHAELIEQGFPYLKTSLLWGKDQARLKKLDRIRDATAETYDWSVVDRDLQA